MANSQFKTYAQHNVATFTGRVASATIRKGKSGEFLSVSLIHNSEEDDSGMEITFTTSAGMLAFVQKGYTLKGRLLTVTGHLSTVEAYYLNDQGQPQLLQRPRLKLTQAMVLTGGLGAAPKAAQQQLPKGTVLMPASAKQELDSRVTPEEEYSDNAADKVVSAAATAPVDQMPPF